MMKDAMKVLQLYRYESIGSTVTSRRNIPCTPYSVTHDSEEGVCISMVYSEDSNRGDDTGKNLFMTYTAI
jgi:hypothetical protein